MERLDIYMFQNGMAESRRKAADAIISGSVTVDGVSVLKPSYRVKEDSAVIITGELLKYVGRGGLKLEKALDCFKLNADGAWAVDIGASTGGFTDCLLQNGASKVYSVDVGTAQLHKKLREDSRVYCLENTDIRDLRPETLQEIKSGVYPDIITVDVSFISVIKIAAAIRRLMDGHTKLILLVKPQFETGKPQVGKNGIVKDEKIHRQVICDVVNALFTFGIKADDIVPSPIKGGDGNREYLLLCTSGSCLSDKSIECVIKKSTAVVKEALCI